MISWATYSSATRPLFILQKRIMSVVTFSKFHVHSSPIFKQLNVVKLSDFAFLNVAAVFMHIFHNRRLSSVFDTFFTQVNERHNQ